MSTLPASWNAPQGVTLQQVQDLAQKLSPYQRLMLVYTIAPRWVGLPFSWEPRTAQEAIAAEGLASSSWGLLERVPGGERSYRVTPLGELVLRVGLVGVLGGEVR
jgi:hypothetical protein